MCEPRVHVQPNVTVIGQSGCRYTQFSELVARASSFRNVVTRPNSRTPSVSMKTMPECYRPSEKTGTSAGSLLSELVRKG